jgi:hypothetical protein
VINLRLPNITAKTEQGQLEQIRSYLYQFAEQLNWALSNIDKQATEATKKVESSTSQKNAVEQAQATFSEVKSLIIKSADIVNAYYQEISHRLDGEYVAESDFGKYKEETSATFTANSEKVSILFNNQQTMQTNLDGLGEDIKGIDDVLVRAENDTKILGSQAWVKIGVLDYEASGFPIYGMEIGQTNTKRTNVVDTKYAQYRSDGVHLFDQNGIEVATIVNYQLKITNAEVKELSVTDKLEFDGYSVTTKNGLGFKWRGRDKA